MNMSGYFETLLRSVKAQDVTELFLWIISIVLIVAFILAVAGYARRFVASAPNLLTSIGILGTFIGIVVGLIGFNPSNIDESIGLLLEGLKTAFITSLAGMGASIFFKIFSTTPLLRRKSALPTGKDVGPAMLGACPRIENLPRKPHFCPFSP